MSNEIEAVTESAKAVQGVANLAEAGGAYLAKMLGTVPEDVVGLLGGDLIHHYRLRNWHKISQKTDEILEQGGIEKRDPLSPKYIKPLLEAASNEGDETLQDMWAQLLANAMNPDHDASLQLEYIEVLKQFKPIDARILNIYVGLGPDTGQSPNNLPERDLRKTEIIVSADRLASVGCLNKLPQKNPKAVEGKTAYRVSALGLELHRACSA